MTISMPLSIGLETYDSFFSITLSVAYISASMFITEEMLNAAEVTQADDVYVQFSDPIKS